MVSLNCCLVSDISTIQQLCGRLDWWYELLTQLHGCSLVLPLRIYRDCREDTFPNKRDSLRRTHSKSKYLGLLPPRCIVVCVLQMPYLRSVFNKGRFLGCSSFLWMSDIVYRGLFMQRAWQYGDFVRLFWVSVGLLFKSWVFHENDEAFISLDRTKSSLENFMTGNLSV